MKFIKIQNTGKKTKVLHTLKSTDYGFVEDGAIFINVEKIWNQSKCNFNHFTKEFNTTCTHELLHTLIAEETDDKASLVCEEKTVRKLTKEKWNKKLEKQYIEDENKLIEGDL